MREHTISCLNLEQIQITTVCRQFSEFIYVNPVLTKANQQQPTITG